MQETRLEQMDPRFIELREARKKMLIWALKGSYARKSDTLYWALLVCITIFVILSPIRGIQSAFLYALGSAALWTMVHRVRRI